MEPFLLNHQYNRLVQQAKVLLTALQTSSDRKVVEAARYSALSKVLEACPELNAEQRQLVERMAELKSTEDFQAYVSEVAGCRIRFPTLTENQLKSLFPKVKKLRMPDLTALEERPLTYLGWVDAGSEKMFLVYPKPGAEAEGKKASDRFTAIEGRFTPANKKGICSFCNRSGETALFTAVSKNKIAHLPDYFKAVGQYICLDSESCNSRITGLEGLETFLQAVTDGR